jgi:flagellar hook-length control protein FliK
MIQRVEVVMKEAARARDGKTISFRVEPYNLGEVKVDVSLRDGALHARLKAENTQVATALRDRAHELQGALRKLGLEVDVVTVTVLNEEPDSGLAADSGGSNSGKNFQGDGHNLPSSNGQPIENTVGNKIAETLVPTAQPLADVILDHWVA